MRTMWALCLGAVMVGAWQVMCLYLRLPSYLVPSPVDVANAVANTFPDLIRQTAVTARAASVSVIIAGCSAILAGTAVFLAPRLSSGLILLVIVLQSFPVVALLPLLVIWFGNDWGPKIALGTFFAFFPQVISVVRSIRTLDAEKVELFETLAASQMQLFFHLVVPSALPGFFSGLRVGAPLAVVGCLVSELAASDRGLGFYMLVASRRLETSEVFAGVVAATVLGVGAYCLTLVLEHFAAPWRTIRIDD
jgi:ABC-type nitrate/sulfonate/bicarbonate transport system permease component